MEEMAAQRYYFLQFLILAFIIILILVILIFILVYRCASKAKQNEIDSLKGSFETVQIFSGTISNASLPVCNIQYKPVGIITLKSGLQIDHNMIVRWLLLISQPGDINPGKSKISKYLKIFNQFFSEELYRVQIQHQLKRPKWFMQEKPCLPTIPSCNKAKSLHLAHIMKFKLF